MRKLFNHPDFSFPVYRRKVTDELLELMAFSLEIAATRGRSLIYRHCYRNQFSYYSALHRLRKEGLIVHRQRGTQRPVLELTPEGERRVSKGMRSTHPWPLKWSGHWYVLVYDVPEQMRKYRDQFRKFLRSLRMGCLQESVWITPVDIRPVFDDLTKAAGIASYGYLFEARTVLGLKPDVLVRSAWDMDEIVKEQKAFLESCEQIDQAVSTSNLSAEKGIFLLQKELRLYRALTDRDPFLPRPLWPQNYLGEEVVRAHLQVVERLKSKMRGS